MPPFARRTFVPAGLMLLAAAALSGCAAMNETECRAADWQTVGYEDGVAGYAGNRIGVYREACAKHGVTPDLAGYQTGLEHGLREYCKPANGFRVGAHGSEYGGVCPADMDREFENAWQMGRQLYTLRVRVSDTANELQAMRNEFDSIDSRVIQNSARIIETTTTNEERAQIVLDTKRLGERKGELKTLIPRVERELEQYQQELRDYRETLQYVE